MIDAQIHVYCDKCHGAKGVWPWPKPHDSLYQTRFHIWRMLREREWQIEGGKHICPSCVAEAHEEVEVKMEPFQRAIEEIARERSRQDAKWGEFHDARHSLSEWLDILHMELREAKVASSDEQCLVEILHLAAVAVAALQHYGVPHV